MPSVKFIAGLSLACAQDESAFFRRYLSLAYRAEEFHLLLNSRLDCLKAGSEELSGVEALALQILACLDVLSCSRRESELALCVYVDL